MYFNNFVLNFLLKLIFGRLISLFRRTPDHFIPAPLFMFVPGRIIRKTKSFFFPKHQKYEWTSLENIHISSGLKNYCIFVF